MNTGSLYKGPHASNHQQKTRARSTANSYSKITKREAKFRTIFLDLIKNTLIVHLFIYGCYWFHLLVHPCKKKKKHKISGNAYFLYTLFIMYIHQESRQEISKIFYS